MSIYLVKSELKNILENSMLKYKIKENYNKDIIVTKKGNVLLKLEDYSEKKI